MAVFSTWHQRINAPNPDPNVFRNGPVEVCDELLARAISEMEKIAIIMGHAWGNDPPRWDHEGDNYRFSPIRQEEGENRFEATNRYGGWRMGIIGDLQSSGPW